jgi:hypothetical protein
VSDRAKVSWCRRTTSAQPRRPVDRYWRRHKTYLQTSYDLVAAKRRRLHGHVGPRAVRRFLKVRSQRRLAQYGLGHHLHHIVIAVDVFGYPVVGTSCGDVARKPAPARCHLDQLCRSSSTFARSVMMPNTRCVVARSSIGKSLYKRSVTRSMRWRRC